MAEKRKRPTKDPALTDLQSSKHARDDKPLDGSIYHPVLSLYYSRVVTLRTFLCEQLPLSSKSRKKKVASLGLEKRNSFDQPPYPSASQEVGTRFKTDEEIQDLAGTLDSTLVGILREHDNTINVSRQKEFASFTQSQALSSLECTDVGATTSQPDIVDFAILTLFNSYRGSFYRPPHLLCHGFQRASNQCRPNHEHDPMSGIRGIVPQYPNKNVSILKNSPWTDVLDLLGKNCEEIMLHLLLDCSIFIQVDEKNCIFYQLSGIPLSELSILESAPNAKLSQSAVENPTGGAVAMTPKSANKVLHTPATITFVRSRMLYARPALNAKGRVRFGLRHIHVFNRYPQSNNRNHTLHILKYIFPRQFGLHNVFTSRVNPKETTQPFKDYTLREEEISYFRNQRDTSREDPEKSSELPGKIPKRLRGDLVVLIQNLQRRHQRCPYVELLRYYCPIENTLPPTLGLVGPQSNSASRQTRPPSKFQMTDYATPHVAVSAFCRGVLAKLIPNELYGCGVDGIKNRNIILRHVDTFVQMRRFESLSLHEVSQGLKITCVKWLQPACPNRIQGLPSVKLSSSDIRKRTEIYLEFVYYIFDSILIPLIRSNFYVTESGVHRNRLFYFRHDIWRRLTEPTIVQLKRSTFEEVKKETAEQILSSRNLGYSLLRLLPKSSGARPIVNLRRRPVRKCGWGGFSELGPSINSLMTPAFNVLNYEKMQRLGLLGATMFSIGDIYSRLKAFKQSKVPANVARTKPFYFVKLDIQSCFDTIPQQRLIQLTQRLVSEDDYLITKHVEIRPADEAPANIPGCHYRTKAKPVRKFISRAAGFTDLTSLYDAIVDTECKRKRHTIFVGTPTYKKYQKRDILLLLQQHIQNNLVKIGKKYFRQRTGIPQGSIVSTLLCNFLYAEYEREKLGFLDHDDTLLLRFIDDYLLITTKPSVAVQFLQVMLKGNEDYGISVNPEKILVNFLVTIDGRKVPRLVEASQRQFPYCGNIIDTYTLSLTKDRTPKDPSLTTSDTITVDATKSAGISFYRKALNSFKIQVHAMFLDTKHNSTSIVMANLYHSFLDSAMKLYEYSRSLCQRGIRRWVKTATMSSALFMRTISNLIEVAVHVIQSLNSTACRTSSGFDSNITRSQIQWLAATAFRTVLGRKQTKFKTTLRWLDGVSRESRPITDAEAVKLRKAVNGRGPFE
ncbi:telomerase reverse transcriptase [Histoplasma capsulatum G186AR]|uniref:Telomerase reverse transcriptase n=2 Tax=Ajellomyces capsulatus TaxID=5037 RepID=C0NWW3_AJECG|nr:telomerase reverse transcriptase [Histoplasma capsulatum G186AR]EEH04418.1 telomerase reverse transcriptase [Histoplasma capsulatum G186AR]KAG5291376.1 telomerase reverse transcriptase [Histoplasma capsulatum]QSS68679.1 telomerase reverse transcriptase [Histoplasma capsulatum G186AR]